MRSCFKLDFPKSEHERYPHYMDLRRLEYFLSVAKHLSITAAAEDLGLAQPTLTKSIRSLEEELGVQLFQRLPRGVELTDFGRSLLRHAEAMHVQVQDALNEIEGLRGGAIGVVTIGAGPSWLRRHLPLAIARTLSRNPSLKVRIDGGYDDALLRALRHGEVDFVVSELPSPERAKDLAITPLTSDSLGVCCREEHPLVGERNIPLNVLLDYPWIMPSRRTRAQRRLQALFIAANLASPDPVVETESMAFLLQMLRELGRSHLCNLNNASVERRRRARDTRCSIIALFAPSGDHNSARSMAVAGCNDHCRRT